MTTEVDLTGRRPDPLLDAQPVTMLEELAGELAEIAGGEVTFPVAARPGYKVTYRTNLDGAQIASLRRGAKDTTQPSGVDEFRWGSAILAIYCVALSRHDLRIVDNGGQPVTFRHQDLHNILGIPPNVPSPAVAAIKKFYGSDAAVSATALALLRAAGYDDEVTPDPTDGSSQI